LETLSLSLSPNALYLQVNAHYMYDAKEGHKREALLAFFLFFRYNRVINIKRKREIQKKKIR
jgi:hypothetical protein